MIAALLATRVAADDTAPTPLPDNLHQLMQADPTLELNAQRYCQEQESTTQWHNLLASFKQPIKTYWHGLISACRGETQEALAHHRRYLRYSAQTSIYPQLAFTAASGVITLGRKLGKSRLWLADSYSALASLWQERDYIDPRALNVSHVELQARKINDQLWSARYETLRGNYARAIALAQQSRREAEAALAAGSKPSTFMPFIAEAYHILAFRVAAERQDYAQAIVLGNEALQYSLDPDWQERFLWYIRALSLFTA